MSVLYNIGWTITKLGIILTSVALILCAAALALILLEDYLKK